MIDIFLFLSLSFMFIFFVGRMIERLKVPWIFAALLLGFLLAIRNPFSTVTSSQTFDFLAEMGMYSLLFMIGFELDMSKLKETRGFIVRATFFIIFLEAFFGSLLVHFVFGYGWMISFLVAMSFATVGEAILIPILDEFNMVNTDLGQSIIGIGTLDNIIELIVLIWIVLLIGSGGDDGLSTVLAIGSLFVLFLLSYGLTRLKGEDEKLVFMSIKSLFLLVLSIFFLFIWIGEFSHASPIAALLAGICLKTFIPEKRLQAIESEIKAMSYGFFAPIFFIWVGISMDVNYLGKYPFHILLVVIVSKGAKLLGSYLVARKQMGTRKSILLGIGLSVRFSTSIIIIKILFENGLVGADLYSIIIASSIVFKFLVPVLFANLLVKWKIAGQPMR
jgi:Kef-type K+ transport system membrane component KefB